MKKIMKILICVMFVITFISFAQAQKVPQSIKAKILADSNCGEGGTTVKSAKVGPSKLGYLAICKNGAGVTYVYEKVGQSIRRIFEASYGMRGEMSISKKVHKGYFEMQILGFSGPYLVIGESFRWNGQSFVQHSCEECDSRTDKCNPC